MKNYQKLIKKCLTTKIRWLNYIHKLAIPPHSMLDSLRG